MTRYTLAPSALSFLWSDCPRCYWRKSRGVQTASDPNVLFTIGNAFDRAAKEAMTPDVVMRLGAPTLGAVPAGAGWEDDRMEGADESLGIERLLSEAPSTQEEDEVQSSCPKVGSGRHPLRLPWLFPVPQQNQIEAATSPNLGEEGGGVSRECNESASERSTLQSDSTSRSDPLSNLNGIATDPQDLANLARTKQALPSQSASRLAHSHIQPNGFSQTHEEVGPLSPPLEGRWLDSSINPNHPVETLEEQTVGGETPEPQESDLERTQPIDAPLSRYAPVLLKESTVPATTTREESERSCPGGEVASPPKIDTVLPTLGEDGGVVPNETINLQESPESSPPSAFQDSRKGRSEIGRSSHLPCQGQELSESSPASERSSLHRDSTSHSDPLSNPNSIATDPQDLASSARTKQALPSKSASRLAHSHTNAQSISQDQEVSGRGSTSPWQTVNESEWVESQPIDFPEHGVELVLRGKTDKRFRTPDGTVYIIDFKAGFSLDPDRYFLAMHAYLWATERPAKGTPREVEGLGLISMQMDKHNPFHMKPGTDRCALKGTLHYAEIPIDRERFLRELGGIARVLAQPEPPPAGRFCAHCRAVQQAIQMEKKL